MNEYLIYLAVMTLVTDLVIVCACIFPGRISGKAGYGRVWLAKNFMVDPGGPSVDADPDDQFHSTCFCSARSRSD